MLRDQLGAELVETRTPDYPDDPAVPNLKYTFADALSEILPRFMPEVFSRRDENGELFFAVPGHDVTSYDYLLKLSRREAPLTPAVNITNFADVRAPCRATPSICSDIVFDLDRYLAAARRRAHQELGRLGREREVPPGRFARRRGELGELQGSHDRRQGRSPRAQLRRAAWRCCKVMYENDIDVFVHPENTVPTPKIQGPNVGTNSLDGITPFFQIPRIVVPAGVTDVDLRAAVRAERGQDGLRSRCCREGTQQTKLPHPMPISITFFAGQGEEPTLIKVGTAYESATHHRFAPPAFGARPASGDVAADDAHCGVTLLALGLGAPRAGATRAVRDRGSDDRRHARGDRGRRDHVPRRRRGVHRARESLQRRLHGARDRRRRGRCARERLRARRQAARVSDADGRGSTIFPDLAEYRGLPLDFGRMEPAVSDPTRRATARHARRHAERGPDQRARDAEHPRRALRDLQGRVRRASFDGRRCLPARPRRARSFASSPTRSSAPRSSTRSTARTRSRRHADVLRRHGAQGSVRHEGHALDVEQRRRTSRWTRRRSTRRSRRGCARKAPSSTRSRTRTNSTRGPAIPAGPPSRARTSCPAARQLSSWSGQACNPYDTERVVRGSTGGSGAAISANLAMIGICEQSAASCQGPASRNGIALLLPTKGLVPDSGGTGNQWFHDRAGIHARTLRDAAYVFDALKIRRRASSTRAIRSRRMPKALVPEQPYASFIVGDDAVAGAAKPLAGMRIAILREHMVKETANHVAISDRIDGEIKTVLRDRLGAELVETTHAGVRGRSGGAEPRVHVRRRALRDPAAARCPRCFSRRNAQGRAVLRGARATTSRATTIC